MLERVLGDSLSTFWSCTHCVVIPHTISATLFISAMKVESMVTVSSTTHH